jgi:hypothetical protein
MTQTIQLGEICRRLEVRERAARYVLERGHVPRGVDAAPESGRYRQFDAGQAFWLGMVLKLKQFGIVAPLAAKIADYAQQSLQGVTQNLNWDWAFNPALGQFDTKHQYCVDVAGTGVSGLEFIRFATEANPSGDGQLTSFEWHHIDQPGHPVGEVEPCVMLRLDLSQIARLLAGAFEQR